MEILQDEKLLEKYMAKYRIREKFDLKDLHFQLQKYAKGEQIVSPNTIMNALLFMVKGTAHIYGLRADESYVPVAVQKPFAMYGDMEFATGRGSTFFVEAKTEVLCVALSLTNYGKMLRHDVCFLNWVLQSLGEKFDGISTMETSGDRLEDQVIFYMQNVCEKGVIQSVNDTVLQLRCSRRQLQRVLRKLCENGRMEKLGKGVYCLKRETDL